MFKAGKIARLGFLPLVAAVVFCGCFSIPFIGRGGEEGGGSEHLERPFARNNVFVGYDKKDRPIVEIRLVRQEVGEHGLLIHTRLFPTENFKVRNIFRGLRSINYYPVERRFHRLELRYGRKKLKAKVRENLQVRGEKPLDAIFEHTGTKRLLPDTIDLVKLKFQSVKRWAPLPPDSIDNWYTVKKDVLQALDRKQRRRSLIDTYRQRQKKDDTKIFTQYDSLYVTTNNTYLYLEKDVNSDILFTLNAGSRLAYGMSDGVWLEVPLPDSLRESVSEFLEDRRVRALYMFEEQRRQARLRRGAAGQQTEIDTTLRYTGYVLDVMVQPNLHDAVEWERENISAPVDVPLFAKVLKDREIARQARIDSIAQAKIDSIAQVQARADSIRLAAEVADSARADSIKAAAAVADSAAIVKPPAAAVKAVADSAKARAEQGAVDSTAAAVPADSGKGPAKAPPDQAPAKVKPPGPAEEGSDSARASPGPGKGVAKAPPDQAPPDQAPAELKPGPEKEGADSTGAGAGPGKSDDTAKAQKKAPEGKIQKEESADTLKSGGGNPDAGPEDAEQPDSTKDKKP